jgi:hypothetical protein
MPWRRGRSNRSGQSDFLGLIGVVLSGALLPQELRITRVSIDEPQGVTLDHTATNNPLYLGSDITNLFEENTTGQAVIVDVALGQHGQNLFCQLRDPAPATAATAFSFYVRPCFCSFLFHMS